MNHEELLRQVLQRVEKELARKPAALLLGEAPQGETGFSYVTQAPYTAVVIGSLDAYSLLHFPDPESLKALLEGKPVYLWEPGQQWRAYAATSNRSLWSRLHSAYRQMLQLGVRPLREERRSLLTAQEVRRRLEQGLPVEGRLTPLARDILEGGK